MKSVFVVGDSISLFYHKYLKENLHGKAYYFRKGNEEEIAKALTIGTPTEQIWQANGGTSKRVLKYFKSELQRRIELKPHQNADIILFNCGLHDIRTMGKAKKHQVCPFMYAHNLRKIISLLKKFALAGFNERIIWINTTPIDDVRHNSVRKGNFRYNADVIKYNNIAKLIMQKNNIEIIDLYTFTKSIIENNDNAFRDEIHYSDNVSKQQADYITKCIKKYL